MPHRLHIGLPISRSRLSTPCRVFAAAADTQQGAGHPPRAPPFHPDPLSARSPPLRECHRRARWMQPSKSSPRPLARPPRSHPLRQEIGGVRFSIACHNSLKCCGKPSTALHSPESSNRSPSCTSNPIRRQMSKRSRWHCRTVAGVHALSGVRLSASITKGTCMVSAPRTSRGRTPRRTRLAIRG